MQAIVTKYIGPTNTKGARIKATAISGSVTVPYEYGLQTYEAHHAAAIALRDKTGWGGHLEGGETPDRKGYAFLGARA